MKRYVSFTREPLTSQQVDFLKMEKVTRKKKKLTSLTDRVVRRHQWFKDHIFKSSADQSKSGNGEAYISEYQTPKMNEKKAGEKSKKRLKVPKICYSLFVGNLSYAISKEDLNQHFNQAGNVSAVRLLTHKETGQPKGFAYVEFKDKESYINGFKLHHSTLLGRKINVEYTARGGSKSELRREKIKRKNYFYYQKMGVNEEFQEE